MLRTLPHTGTFAEESLAQVSSVFMILNEHYFVVSILLHKYLKVDFVYKKRICSYRYIFCPIISKSKILGDLLLKIRKCAFRFLHQVIFIKFFQ